MKFLLENAGVPTIFQESLFSGQFLPPNPRGCSSPYGVSFSTCCLAPLHHSQEPSEHQLCLNQAGPAWSLLPIYFSLCVIWCFE
ncbi:Ligand-Dependent Corepressor [Manis pentadactyla]|nr:Ligand-Dependent Corepressor [Manis pentadactyla]